MQKQQIKLNSNWGSPCIWMISGMSIPPAASRNTFGFQPDDWIYWRTAPVQVYQGVQETLEKSPVVAYLGTKTTTNIFRCPGDISDRDRIAVVGGGKVNDPSNPIYWAHASSMLSAGLDANNNVNLGLTSVMQNVGRRNPINSIQEQLGAQAGAQIISFARGGHAPQQPRRCAHSGARPAAHSASSHWKHD